MSNVSTGQSRWQKFHQGQKESVLSELAALKRNDDVPELSGGLATYMLKRSVMGRKFDTTETSRLISANSTVEQTRALLSKGRGNVSSDVANSGGESTWRTEAGRQITAELNQVINKTVEQNNPGLTSALGAMAVRAGNCGEHGTITTHLDAHRLQSEQRTGESVYRATSTATDHGWAERRDFDGKKRQTDIVMDAWGKGTAVERSDSAFGQQLRDRYHFDKNKMPTHDFRELAKKIPDGVKQRANEKFQVLKQDNFRYSSNWGTTSVYSERFHSEAKTALSEIGTLDKLARVGETDLRAGFSSAQLGQMKKNSSVRPDFLKEIHKVGVLRSAGASLHTAKSMTS